MSLHLTEEELHAELQKRSLVIPLGSIWYHRKKPDISYMITDLVIDESTDSVAVVYEQQTTHIRFVRLATIFVEDIQYDTLTTGPRFLPLSS